MAGSGYMDVCFSTSDHYGMVPHPINTLDPSCDLAAHFYYSKRVPSKETGSYDPNRQIVTSYGITNIDGQDIGWQRVDREGSSFDPNSTTTKAVILKEITGTITVYNHIWPRVLNDPMSRSTSSARYSPAEADKLRQDIAKVLSHICKK